MVIVFLFYHDKGLKVPPSDEIKCDENDENLEINGNSQLVCAPKNKYKIKEIKEINITSLPQLFLKEQVFLLKFYN